MQAKKVIRAILIGIPALLLLLLVSGVIIINTPFFRNFLRSEIRKEAWLHAGARVEIGSLETRWTHLDFVLNHVTIFSAKASASGQPAFLRAQRLEVAIPFAPLLHGQLRLRQLILDQPDVKILVDAQGETNIPVPPPSQTPSGGIARLFDLEIGDCAVHSGEIYYNDSEIPLDAELHHLAFQAGYSILTGNYAGSLSYHDGRFVARKIASLTHSASLKFSMDRSGLSISPLLLTTEKSQITLNARLNGYSHPVIDGAYQAVVETSDVAYAFRYPSLPVGTVDLHGSVDYRSTSGASFLDAIRTSGSASSERLNVGSGRPFAVTAITAQYDLRNADLQVTNLRAAALGGAVAGDWQMQNLAAKTPASRLDATVRGISLAVASATFAPPDVRKIPFSGTADLNVRASWVGPISDAVAHLRLAVVSRQKAVSSRSIPLNALVVADYDGPRNTLTFAPSHLQTAHTQLTISGSLRPRRGTSMLAVRANTADLSEVASLAELIQSATARGSAPPTFALPALGGSATLSANITGTLKNPQVQSRLTAQNLQVDGSFWRSLRLDSTASPDQVSVRDGMISGSGREQIAFTGSAGLHRWSLQPASQISLQAAMNNMPVAELQAIGHLQYPVTGMLSAKLSVQGTREAPLGSATISLASGSAWNQPIQNLAVDAQASDGNIRATLKVDVPAGMVTSTASYRISTQEYQLSLASNGIDLAKLALLQRRADVQGVASLSATGHGTLHNPQLTADLNIPQFKAQGQTASNIDARITVANEHAGLQLQMTAAQGSVEAKGDIALTGEHYMTASVDVRSLPIAAVIAAALPSESPTVGGQTEIHLTAMGPLSMPSAIEARVQIPTLNVTYGKNQIELARPLEAEYRAGTLTVSQGEIEGTGTHISFGGTIPIAHAGAYSLSANGTVDLTALNKFVPGLKSSGLIEVDLHGQGRSGRPNITGQLTVKDAVFTTDTLPVGLEGLNAQINISGERADIANFSGTAGGGSVTAKGFVSFGQNPNFDLALNAQSVRVRYPAGLRSLLSGQINLIGSAADSALTGRVLVDNLSFTQQFDLSTFASSFGNESGGGTSPSSFANNMKLRIAVQSAQNLSLASRENKLTIGGSANLNVIGTLANPVILGRVDLTSGEVFYLGKRFDVQSGTIEFANPVRTEPVIRLAVTTKIDQYDVTMNLNGPVDQLKTSYTSVPALAPADIIHLLAFGNTYAEANSEQTSASLGVESALASQVSGQVAGKLESLTGISQLTIDPLATNIYGNIGAQIGIQERVTGSLLFTFSTDVTTTQEQTVELQYDLNKTWSVTALRDQNGGYGLNLRYHKSF